MLTRYAYPVLFSVAGVLFFLLPMSSHRSTHVDDFEIYLGKNTISFDSEHLPMPENSSLKAELSHNAELFYLNLWIGEGSENRITFVIKNDDIKETAYELNQPSIRYLSFLYHGKDCSYSSDDYYTGMLMIHEYDTAKNIIAGSFEFMAYSYECDELIRVKNGSFDATFVNL